MKHGNHFHKLVHHLAICQQDLIRFQEQILKGLESLLYFFTAERAWLAVLMKPDNYCFHKEQGL